MSDRLDRVTGNESLRKYFDSPYMGAYSINDKAEPVLTIAELMYGKITLEGGRKEEHIVVRFVENQAPGMCEVKPLVLNATNQKTLEKLYGKGADVLIGKRVQFFIDPAVKAIGGGITEGIRIRPLRPKEAVPIPPCGDCQGEIKDAMGKAAAFYGAYGQKNYGTPLCVQCLKKRKAADASSAVAVDETPPDGSIPEEVDPDAIDG